MKVVCLHEIAPAKDAIRYKTDLPPANDWENDMYMGELSFEGDIAWNELMECMFCSDRTHCVEALTPHLDKGFRLSSEEAARLNLSATPLPGNDHATMLSVYHNLHCLVNLSRGMLPLWYQVTDRLTTVSEAHTTAFVRGLLLPQPDRGATQK